MNSKILRREQMIERDETTFEMAVKRFEILYERFDTVVVCFSGGKDSMVTLEAAVEASSNLSLEPPVVVFWDEEAIYRETREYVARTSERADIRFVWLALPVKCRNACSRSEPFFYPWDASAADRWVYPLPEGAVAAHPEFRAGMTHTEMTRRLFPASEFGQVAVARGLRAQESLYRYMNVARDVPEAWLSTKAHGPDRNVFEASPVYDSTVEDIWLGVAHRGWDYNRAYDTYAALGVGLSAMRVGPLYCEEALANIRLLAEYDPRLYERILARVEGAATRARYADTSIVKPGLVERPARYATWEEYTYALLDEWHPELGEKLARQLRLAIRLHEGNTNDPIRDEETHPITGISWRELAIAAYKGDWKGRRLKLLTSSARHKLTASGLSVEEIRSLQDEDYVRGLGDEDPDAEV